MHYDTLKQLRAFLKTHKFLADASILEVGSRKNIPHESTVTIGKNNKQ